MREDPRGSILAGFPLGTRSLNLQQGLQSAKYNKSFKILLRCALVRMFYRTAIFLGLGSLASPGLAEVPNALAFDVELASFRLPDPESSDRDRLALVEDGCPEMCADDTSATIASVWTDHVPSGQSSHPGFWNKVRTVKTESLVMLGYFSVISGSKFLSETTSFHFKDEGWLDKDSRNVGMDKFAHAYGTYLLTEYLHGRIHRRANASEGDALTAAALASTLVLVGEISDGFEPDSGWSMNDVAMNLAGAGFSVLCNTVPGLKEKMSFKIEVVPNDNVYSFWGRRHFQQQRYMLSLKGAGFNELNHSPLRYLDLQVGYHASDFLLEDRLAGIEPRRHFFVGLGLNVGELFFRNSRSKFGRTAYTVLDYFQLPGTSIRYSSTDQVEF